MLRLTASIEGPSEIERALSDVLHSAATDGLADLAASLREAVSLQFTSAGEAYGTPWPPRKETRPAPWPIGIRSGRLFHSLTDQRSPEHIEQILAGPGSRPVLLFGSAVPYSGFFHFGTEHQPPRPVLTPEMLSS